MGFKIDHTFIRQANERLQWDGIWGDTIQRIRRDAGVHEALDEACQSVGKARLILCSWATARELLLEGDARRPQGHFDTSTTYQAAARALPFQRDLEAEERHMLECGYIGTYRGAVVIASVYLGVWERDFAIVSTEADPLKVDYDGANCVMVDMTCEE